MVPVRITQAHVRMGATGILARIACSVLLIDTSFPRRQEAGFQDALSNNCESGRQARQLSRTKQAAATNPATILLVNSDGMRRNLPRRPASYFCRLNTHC